MLLRNTTRLAASTLLLVGGLGLVGCGGNSSSASMGTPTPTPSPTPSAGVVAGVVAGDSSTPQINHNPVNLGGATVTMDGQAATSGMVQPGMVMTGMTTQSGMGMGSGMGSGSYTMQSVQLMSSFMGWVQTMDAANGRMTVMGQAIQVNALTQLAQENQDGTYTTLAFSDFLAGDYVSVYGSFLSDGSYMATRVDRRKPGMDTSQQGMMGQVTNLSTATNTFTMGTWTVNYGSATMTGTPANGAWMQVRGTATGSQITATWANVMGAMGNPGSSMGLRGIATNLNTSAKTFSLMNLTVNYGTATITGTLAEGAMVEVQGALATGSTTLLNATAVQVEFSGMGGGMGPGSGLSDTQAKGTISALDQTAKILTVSGTTYWFDASTLIMGLDVTMTPSQLKVGDWVAVMADSTRKNASGYAYATRIAEMMGNNGGMGTGDLMGPAASVNASTQTLVLNGINVTVTSSTTYASQGVSISASSFWGSVQAGSMIEAFGAMSGSSFAATRLVLGGMNGMGGGMGSGGGMGNGGGMGTGSGTGLFSAAMPVPAILAPTSSAPGSAAYNLKPQVGTTAFLSGKPTTTWGYNGAILGPTLRVHRGDAITVQIDNQLPEATTVHWHGLIVPSTVDGGPMDSIAAGTSTQRQFTVNQPAATLWYHPHIHGHTGYQVNMGLAGFLLVDDPVSDALALPKTYGVDDFPVAIQDRMLDANGNLVYLNTGMGGVGMMGNQILANGVITPYLEVPAGRVRLRLLDGSNARRFAFYFQDNRSFQQISSDGGLLTAPTSLSKLPMAPGERADILVDFSQDAVGTTLELRSDNMVGMGNMTASGAAFPVLQIRVTKVGSATTVPGTLASISKTPESQATVTRTFQLSDMGTFAINGKTYDPARIDEHVQLNATEIWEVIGSSVSGMGSGGMGGGMGSGTGMAHPFHIHGVQFQVLSRSTGAVAANEQGWKDTVLVSPAEHVRLIMKFTQAGDFPYHCHILEHEDRGMMGLFEVK